jgi:hypothetical protein
MKWVALGAKKYGARRQRNSFEFHFQTGWRGCEHFHRKARLGARIEPKQTSGAMLLKIQTKCPLEAVVLPRRQ